MFFQFLTLTLCIRVLFVSFERVHSAAVDIEKCLNYCANGAKCVIIENYPKCHCLPGWEGEHCNNVLQVKQNETVKNSVMSRVYPRSSLCARVPPSMCKNGGICIDLVSKKVACQCPSIYTGKHCEEESACYNYCKNGGICTITDDDEPSCDCSATGFTGPTCRRVLSTPSTTTTLDPLCAGFKGVCDPGRCYVKADGELGCICPPTHTGEHCETPLASPSDAIDVQLVGGVLTRNSWTDIGAAVDVTGSMAKCYARLDQWLGLSQSNKLLRYFDFFNDGDRTPDANKVIGSTGGIYGVFTSEGMNKVTETLEKAEMNGNGGDAPENDIEAILHTIRACPECENIIHVADNAVTPRDMSLLSQVTKPVKVLVCKLAPNDNVNPRLLDIARVTGGSVHTLEWDIDTLGTMKSGDIIRVGKGTYRLGDTEFTRIA